MSDLGTQPLPSQLQQPIATKTHLELSVEAGGIGLWYWDAPANNLYWSDQQHRLYGMKPGSFEGTVQAFHALVVPEDLQTVINNKAEKDNGINSEYEYRFRIRRPDGAIRWMLARSRTAYNPDGVLQHITGINIDITEQQEAQEQLAASEAFSRTALESSPDCVKILDLEGRLQYMNANGICLMELDDFEALKGKQWAALWPKEEQPKVIAAINEASAGRTAQFQAACPTGKNTIKWWDVIVRPVHDDKENIRQIISVSRDVTLQKKADAALKASEERYQNFMQRSSEGIWRFEVEQPLSPHLPVTEQIAHIYRHAYLAECNDAMARMYGYTSAKDLVGVRLTDFFPANADSKAYFTHFIEQGYQAQNLESKELDKEGRIRYFQNNLVGIKEGGMLVRAWGTQTDITERKVTEEKIRRSEDEFRSFSNNIQNLAWMADGKGYIYWYNQRWYDYTETTLKEMEGWGWEKVHHPHHIERVVNFVKEAWQKPQPWELTFPLRGADGVYRWFLTRAEPVLDSEGKISRWIGTNTNVDEQIKTQERLAESEGRFRTLANDTTAFMFMADAAANVEFANQQWLDFVGLDNITGVGQAWRNVTHPEDVDWSFVVYADAVARLERYQMIIRQKRTDGQWRWIRWDGVCRKDNSGNFAGVIGVGIDVTEQKEAEELIQQSEERFRTLANTIMIIVFTARPDGYVDYYNQRWYDYTGFQNGLGDQSWLPALHPDEAELVAQTWHNATQTKTNFEMEFRLKNTASGEYRWFLSRALPLRNTAGEVVKWFGSLTDVHEQKTFTERLEQMVHDRTQELQRSNQDLQQFAHVASHDLQEPVRKVKIFGQRLADELQSEGGDKASFYLGKILNAANRMGDMIEGILNYSSLNAATQSPRPVNLNQVVQQVATDLELPVQQKGATITAHKLPVVYGMPVLLHQLFYNLVNNALKFSKADVPTVIEISGREVDQFAEIRIKDNGIGFDPEFAQKIFESFTRLNPKDQYEGTGLGLSLCKKIAERHGGSITATGKEGEGAEFCVRLPVTRKG